MFFFIENTSFWLSAGTILFLTILFLFAGSASKAPIVCFLIIGLLNIILQSRTGFCVSLVCLVVYLIVNRIIISWLLIFVLVLLTVSAFLFKKDSTSGRLFILQNTIELIRDNPDGIGWDKFKAVYNLQQVEYFKKNLISDKTALLADNVEFALNEYLQITAEGGVFTGIAFILFNLLTLGLAIRQYRSKASSLLLAAIIGFTGVLTTCLTFYALHCWWMLGFYFISLFGIYGSFLLPEKKLKWVLLCCTLLLIPPLVIGTLKEKGFKSDLNDAVNLSGNGYKSLADSIFNTLNRKNPDNPAFMIEKGRHLFLYGQFDSALIILKKVKSVISNSLLYTLLGDVYLSIKKNSEAEYYYETAVYMVPNRFISRKKLADFYNAINQRKKEIFWLRSIIDLPEKIPSEITNHIKNQAAKRLSELKS